mmetsp:Transcript_49288/g.120174  ORF Transcript_49288/g.120174 Transcript_49288/m.120174 type:complete len:209 (-) Transcript_49288:631-1257(-)
MPNDAWPVGHARKCTADMAGTPARCAGAHRLAAKDLREVGGVELKCSVKQGPPIVRDAPAAGHQGPVLLRSGEDRRLLGWRARTRGGLRGERNRGTALRSPAPGRGSHAGARRLARFQILLLRVVEGVRGDALQRCGRASLAAVVADPDAMLAVPQRQAACPGLPAGAACLGGGHARCDRRRPETSTPRPGAPPALGAEAGDPRPGTA